MSEDKSNSMVGLKRPDPDEEKRFPRGCDLWEPFGEFTAGWMTRGGAIDPSDQELFTLTDPVDEAVAALESGMVTAQ